MWWSAYLLATVYLVGAGLFFFRGKAVPLDPGGVLGSLQRLYAGDRKKFQDYVEATRTRLERLRATRPQLGSYEKARSGSALRATLRSDRAHVYAAGAHTAFGHEFYVDELGFRYADRITYQRVSVRHYDKNVLVLGGSVAFGFSPESTVAFSDVMNETQHSYRFYNASVPGADCGTAAASLREIVSATQVKFDRVLVYQGINYLPFVCDPDWLVHATKWEDVQRQEHLLAERLSEMQAYDPQSFSRCARSLIEPARKLGIGVTYVTVALAYDEQFHDRELYDEMVNGQCDAQIQLLLVRKHNAALRALAEQDPPVQVIDAAALLFGRDEYFWDPVHLNPRGNQRMAELLLAELGEQTTAHAAD